MGNSQSSRTRPKTKMNTMGKAIAGGIGMVPGGPVVVPLFEKASSHLEIFRTKPNEDNDSVLENMRARHEAERLQGDSARAAKEAAIADAERRAELTIQIVHQAMKAREEAVSRVLEMEAREKKAARDKEHEEHMAEGAKAQKVLDDTKKKLKKARADAKRLSSDLRSSHGLRGVLSKEDERQAKEQIEYNPEKLHFAICGPSGSGKSSLINAFRGIELNDVGAAPIGEVETTKTITRYPDLRTDEHWSRFVWYDIPGAGTKDVKGKDYFRNQRLFVFDFVIIVYGERFTEIALDIIEECIQFKIPMFVVRSKSDSHIENKMKMKFGRIRAKDPSYGKNYEAMKDEYVKDTKHDFNLQVMKLIDSEEVNTNVRLVLSTLLHVYNISAFNIKEIVQSAKAKRDSDMDQSEYIDEFKLIDDMITAAARRRYPICQVKAFMEKSGLDIVTGTHTSVFENSSDSDPSSSD